MAYAVPIRGARMSVASNYVAYSLTSPGVMEPQVRTFADVMTNSVRLRFLYCGVCGSDLSMFEDRRPLAYPRSLGHEFIAEVVDVGADVVSLQPNDIVTSDLNYRCGYCDHCEAGRSHLCRKGQIGIFSNRAFAEYGDIDPSYLVRIDGPPRFHLALSEPLSCVLHALEWAAPAAGERVLVVGAGGLGTCMAFALSHYPGLTAFDITDISPSRLSLIGDACKAVGTAVEAPTGEYDVVFDLSGSESGLLLASACVISGGRLCTMSHLEGETAAPFLLNRLMRRDVTFKLSYLNGERSTLHRAAEMLRKLWTSDWDEVIELVPLDSVADALAHRRTSPWCKTIVQVAKEVNR
jgi:threonine dehydrogenase-like Zn-dependent dehydrogenase